MISDRACIHCAPGEANTLQSDANSLAIRIPVEVAEKAGLKEGDEATLAVTAEKVIEIRHEDRQAEAIRLLHENRIKVPYAYKFDRNEIYDS